MTKARRLRFAIDNGGTFTDNFARSKDVAAHLRRWLADRSYS